MEHTASNGGPSPLTSTYRVQMNAGFTFARARARVPYFARLGISHLYCSPILAARRGSMHGYDVIDPTKLNPELGSEADLRALTDELHRHDMGLIVDIVPNHMGIGAENKYWDDVLAYGERSRYARWFDIDWAAAADRGRRVVLPILADELDRVLDRGELAVELSSGTARVTYFSHSLPVDPATLPAELQLAQLDATEAGEIARRYAGPAARERLRALLDVQHYQLVHWRRGPDEINYRRFFEVNDLAAVRVEDETVFRETHAYLLQLMHDGVVDGLRVDHVDGLLDPRQYLARLRAAVRADTPIFVEKILSPAESLRPNWPIQGTTGYEFLNALEDMFIDASGYDTIERTYRALRRLGRTTFRDIARSAKAAVLQSALRADVVRVANLALGLARAAGKPWSRDELADAIIAFVAALPVYRTYVDGRSEVDDADRDVVNRAAREAAPSRGHGCDIVSFVASLVLGDAAVDSATRLEFVQRLQQLSGPAAAKGVEDTALYLYVPLVSRNEVGGTPDRPLTDAAADLHAMNHQQQGRWPLGLRCTNTHDTKRSADVRARLDALAQIPREWARVVRRWRRLNAKHRRTVKGRIAPDTNTEYVTYQTLVAIWPAPRAHRRADDLPDRAWRDAACERLTRYMLKAAREAKTRTSWTEPDATYEDALRAFVVAILEPAEDAPFLVDVARLVSRVAPIGAWISLSRIAIHLTAPGTPDLYQGDELWNQTLVDPDNRRQIDYDARIGALADLPQFEKQVRTGTVDPADPRLKLLVTHRLLAARRADPGLFRSGDYEPLAVHGARATNVFAFARSCGGRHALVIAARPTEPLVRPGAAAWWADTVVELPPALRDCQWRSLIAADQVRVEDRRIEVTAVLGHLPCAVLVS